MGTTKKAKNPRFEVYLGALMGGRDWRWRLYARNGEIVASGEGYTLEKDAKRAVRAVMTAVRSIEARAEAA